MQIERASVEAIVWGLGQVFEEGRSAGKVIETILKNNRNLEPSERAFVAEGIYEIVRWKRLAQFVGEVKTDDYWGCWLTFGAYWLLQEHELPEWSEFKHLNAIRVGRLYKEARSTRAVLLSLPDWMDKVGHSELKEKWAIEINALNKPSELILRANSLKSTPKKLVEELDFDHIEAEFIPDYPDAVLVKQKQNLFWTPAFKEGWFEVQDASSQMVARALDVQAGMRVVDACAGAGGKTLHLAALMENKGRIIALDVEEYKLTDLKLRARRAGVGNIEMKVIDNKTIKRLKVSADRLLLDVPCSGLGVLRRNPDTKWNLSRQSFEALHSVQWDILSSYGSMLKPGGKMVYSTCSILPSESENQVQRLLAEQPEGWELLSERRYSPATDGFDGFYVACLLKK